MWFPCSEPFVRERDNREIVRSFAYNIDARHGGEERRSSINKSETAGDPCTLRYSIAFRLSLARRSLRCSR